MQSVREILGKDLRCVVICDGLKAHFHEILNESLEKNLPSHSSHITQMLDISLFNALKKRYASTPSNSSNKSEFARNLMRIKTAYESIVSDELFALIVINKNDNLK